MHPHTEAQMEKGLVEKLKGMQWRPVALAGEKAIWSNLRTELEAHNRTQFSDAEFDKIRAHLSKGTVFERAGVLRDRFALARDNGSTLYVQFLNSEEWCRNRYQVARQIRMQGNTDTRTDVTLLINGLPLCHIELKRRGTELKKAFNQIVRYQRDTFKTMAGGLFQFVQIFVISNGVNTRYYAHDRKQSYRQTFPWTDTDNIPINTLDGFVEAVLEPCMISKLIARYMVLNQSEKRLMVMRPYQYRATEAVVEAVERRQGNGYIWHTTGSGKTLTSFKAAQLVARIPKIARVVFVVDRKDLNTQTMEEFESYEPESVTPSSNTRALVRALGGHTQNEAKQAYERRPILTTIQKLASAMRGQADMLESVRHGRIVFIFDECHRSQFGDVHKRLTEFFPNAQLFGFTGTPIFAANAIGQRTTRDLFHKRLHQYTITDAIRDGNVLPFSVEYHAFQASGNTTAEFGWHGHAARREAIVDWICANHHKKTHGHTYGAMLCVSSIDEAIAYWEAFKAKSCPQQPLRVATVFSTDDNEDDSLANGLIERENAEEWELAPAVESTRRDVLERIVQDYNTTYGTSHTTTHAKGLDIYQRDIQSRMKARDREDFIPEKGIDILIVVQMFLTGFDVRRLNTLYVDRELRHHGLIQAFSRTNRIVDERKASGQIVCFRNLSDRVDEAIALFADTHALEKVVLGDYDAHLQDLMEAVIHLHTIAPTPADVDTLPDEHALASFARAFRAVLRAYTALSSFSQFDEDDLPMSQDTFAAYRSKYLDLAKTRTDGHPDDHGPLDDIDFSLELLRQDHINVAYILNLLRGLKDRNPPHEDRDAQKARILALMESDPLLHNKAPIVAEFLHTVFDGLDSSTDVAAAFRSFWEQARRQAIAQVCAEHTLEPVATQDMIDRVLAMTDILPKPGDIRTLIVGELPIRTRKSRLEAARAALLGIVETFDDNIGDIFQDAA